METTEEKPKKRKKRASPNRIKHNRMAALIAKTEGFGLLKNKSQRSELASEVMARYGEDIFHKRYYGIIETAECIYWFGILPRKVNELIDTYDSAKDIAKLLGHTELRIQRAMDHVVSDNINNILDDADKWTG
ncbi:hypothetical protein SAMN05216326_1274 [Nitrosomonas marina]|uniref:Uncharacterized protein n=1 Tax=Nitrosomonas marina TaxID=917 RepID=A0A1I0EFA5_9PROT|nr:hypothetical protein [Nitrosomonas marina]SET43787.1 hypothetical protein SAMN05216326_1274 [Nitrosomonas marina]